MTKIHINPKDVMSTEEIFDNLSNSPYYKSAWYYMEKKGIQDPSIADLFEAFHELAKKHHKINKRKA